MFSSCPLSICWGIMMVFLWDLFRSCLHHYRERPLSCLLSLSPRIIRVIAHDYVRFGCLLLSLFSLDLPTSTLSHLHCPSHSLGPVWTIKCLPRNVEPIMPIDFVLLSTWRWRDAQAGLWPRDVYQGWCWDNPWQKSWTMDSILMVLWRFGQAYPWVATWRLEASG